jgi:hypothetical protein
MKYKVGDLYPVWWDTGTPKVDGFYQAIILEIKPYTGRFTDIFKHVFKLSAPNTRRGWMEMSIE